MQIYRFDTGWREVEYKETEWAGYSYKDRLAHKRMVFDSIANGSYKVRYDVTENTKD